MYARQTKIINRAGLHARPATIFVSVSKGFQSEITIRNAAENGDTANAKSIIMLLATGLACGTTVEISASGPDEREAVETLVELVESGFGEEVT